jgi:hypothetical protein
LSTASIRLPGIEVKVYNDAIQVSKPLGAKPGEEKELRIGIKKVINKFSRKTKKSILLWFALFGNLLDREITLTYPADYPVDIREAQKDLESILRWLERKGVKSYIWFKEYQDRGAVHFHILIDSVFIHHEDLSLRWSKRIKSVDPSAGTSIRKIRDKTKMRTYVTKYFGKEEQKTVPDEVTGHGRWWGSNKKIVPTDHFVLEYEDRKEMCQVYRVIDNFYGNLLKKWSKLLKRKYKRTRKRTGFTVFEEGKRVESVLLRLLNEHGAFNLRLIDA